LVEAVFRLDAMRISLRRKYGQRSRSVVISFDHCAASEATQVATHCCQWLLELVLH